MYRSRPPGSLDLPAASPLATAEETMPDADQGFDRDRGVDPGCQSAPDTGGFRRRRAPRRLDRRAPVFSSLAEPFASIRALPPSAALATELGAGRRTRPTGTPQSGFAGLRVGTLLHPPEHVVEVEAGGL